jgi:Leucine-rich repeat (LRR) protein
MHTLYLSGTDISDLSPLAGLTGMHTLYLIGTKASDLSPLAGLTGLHTLELCGTEVSDASVAELQRSLPNLTAYR